MICGITDKYYKKVLEKAELEPFELEVLERLGINLKKIIIATAQLEQEIEEDKEGE